MGHIICVVQFMFVYCGWAVHIAKKRNVCASGCIVFPIPSYFHTCETFPGLHVNRAAEY